MNIIFRSLGICVFLNCVFAAAFPSFPKYSPGDFQKSQFSKSETALNLRSLTSLSLTRGVDNEKERIWQSSPWQWRGKNAIGPAPQSFIPPLFLDANGNVLLTTLGGGISVYNLKTGNPVWSLPIAVGVASAPDLRNGFVYFAGMDGKVRKVRAETGALVWETFVGSESLGGVRVSGQSVYVTTADDALWSLDESTGQNRWTYKRPAPQGSVYWSLRGSSIPLLDPEGLRVFVGFSDGVFVCLESGSGKTLWERKFERPGRFKDADQWVQFSADGKFILVPLVDGDLLALKPTDGTTLWTFGRGGGSPPLVDEDRKHLYISTDAAEIQKISAENTRSLWTSKLGAGYVSLPVSLGPEYLGLSHSNEGFLVLSKATGVVVFREAMGPGLLAPPAYDGHEILVMSPRNRLYRFLMPAQASN